MFQQLKKDLDSMNMSTYEKDIVKKWIYFLIMILIAKYPLGKFLGKNDTFYLFIFSLFTIISIVQILTFKIKNKKKDSSNHYK